jgi:hypothetical protein
VLPLIIPDAYRSLLRRGKIGTGIDQIIADAMADLIADGEVGTGAGQLAAGDHVHAGMVTDAYADLVANSKIGAGAAQVAQGDHVHPAPIIWKATGGPVTIQNDSSYNIDADLRDIAVPVGKYHFRSILFVKTTAAQDFKYKWVFSGTALGLQISRRVYNEALALQYCGSFLQWIGQNVNYPADLTALRPIIIEGIIEITVPGNLELQWAQLLSGATDTTLGSESFVMLTPLP